MSNHEFNSIGSTDWKYAKPAAILHWLLAVLIASLVGLGWYMMSIEDDPGSDWYFNLHKSFGIVVFGLVLLRIIWRGMHRPVHCPGSSPLLFGQPHEAASADSRLCTAVHTTRNRDVWLFSHCFHFARDFRIGQTVHRCEAPARSAEIRGLPLVHSRCGPLNGPAVCVEPEVELQ